MYWIGSAVVIYALVHGIVTVRRVGNLKKEGVPVTATVVAIVKTPKGYGNDRVRFHRGDDIDISPWRFSVVVEFSTECGMVQKMIGPYTVSYDTYSTGLGFQYQLGQQIPIVYDSDNPENADLAGSGTRSVIGWIFIAIVVCIFTVLLMILVTQPAYADTGPKPSITVHCSNMPGGEVYLDLLIDAPPLPEDAGFSYGNMSRDEPDGYNGFMIDILKAYNVDGWRPALVTGTRAPLWGELRLAVDNGNAVSGFRYMDVPGRFKIIVVTEDGSVAVSNVVERRTFQSDVFFDYGAGRAYERNPLEQIPRHLAVTLTVTLIIEGLILLLFRFSLRQNWKPFLFINLGTQLALNLLIAYTYANMGAGLAIAAYILAELLILIVETVLFILLLKQHKKLRRGLFAISANVVSFAAGFILMPFIMVL